MLKINNRFLSLYDYNFLLMNQGLEKIFSLKPKTRHDILFFNSFYYFLGPNAVTKVEIVKTTAPKEKTQKKKTNKKMKEM